MYETILHLSFFIFGFAVLTWLSYKLYLNESDLLVQAALYAVSLAEQQWGSKTGKIKFAEVYTYLKRKFPVLAFFLPESYLCDMIEKSLAEMKRILEEKEKAEAIENKDE